MLNDVIVRTGASPGGATSVQPQKRLLIYVEVMTLVFRVVPEMLTYDGREQYTVGVTKSTVALIPVAKRSVGVVRLESEVNSMYIFSCNAVKGGMFSELYTPKTKRPDELLPSYSWNASEPDERTTIDVKVIRGANPGGATIFHAQVWPFMKYGYPTLVLMRVPLVLIYVGVEQSGAGARVVKVTTALTPESATASPPGTNCTNNDLPVAVKLAGKKAPENTNMGPVESGPSYT